jgi:hypothetical protein
MEGSWRWFRDVVGLPAKGLFPSPNIGKRYASKKECEKLWGKRKSNNGFRYTSHEDEALKIRIETLIRQVYQRKQTINSDITLTFALGVLAERKGFSINWAKFAEGVHRRKGSFSPLPEYKNATSSQDGEEEEYEEEEDTEDEDFEVEEEEDQEEEDQEEEDQEEEDQDEEHHDEEHEDEKEEEDQEDKEEEVEGEKEDVAKPHDIGLQEGAFNQDQDQRGDDAFVTDLPAVNDQQVIEEALVQPEPDIVGGPDADQFQSPRQGVLSKDAPTDCIQEDQLGAEVHGHSPFAEKVATNFELNTTQDKENPVGETHGDGLNQSHVGPGIDQIATPPLSNEGLQMPPTLATEIDDNGLLVMERAVRLKEVRLREDQVKFKRELLQFRIGQLALKRKFLQVGSPADEWKRREVSIWVKDQRLPNLAWPLN